MTPTLLGLHHVSAISGDAQKNVDFYTTALGLRFVKCSVNFDDPSSYHLYYGDATGSPGSAMTFFVWPDGRGRAGSGQASATAFSVPIQSIDYWQSRMSGAKREERFGEPVLSIDDPDGLKIELIGVENDSRNAWDRGPVPAEHGIKGFHSVTLSLEASEGSAKMLTETLGYRKTDEAGNRFRFAPAHAGGDIVPTYVDLLCQPDLRRGLMGVGQVHHVAFRTPDDAQEAAWLAKIGGKGFNISPIMERKYFRSIYFREPGGVLFEIATEKPGFTIDESFENLGTKLQLPPWVESHRAELEAILPKIKLPAPLK